ncbi:MAG: M23 family metallopeptidase [Actinomycetota bacterium]
MRIVIRRRSAWLAASVLAAGAAFAGPAAAQVPPLLGPGSTTTTTTPAPQPEPSSPPPSGPSSGFDGADQAPAGAQDTGGDGAPAPSGGIRVPPEAQRIIDSVARTGPSSSDALLEALAPVEALGLPRDEVLRLGMGRFPIAGPARYSHDWLFPRYGPGFRFHLGTDVFAPYGTPVRAPVDGIAKSANGGLGGLTVKVYMEDGTYFYLAHLSGLVDGFTDGMAVKTGDIVGYVGDSGNARGTSPHLHIGIYPRGGPAVDPKPILDGFLQEAMDRVPALIEAVEASRPTPAAPAEPLAVEAALPDHPTLLRPMLHRVVLRVLDEAASTAGWSLT